MPEQETTATKTLQWGTSEARKGPVPKYLRLSYQAIGVLSVIWAFLIEPAFSDKIPLDIAHRIDQILIGFNTIYYQICQQFGYVTQKEEPSNASTPSNP